MDFRFTEEQDELRELTARILGDHATPDRLRALEAASERIDRRLWSALAEANLLGAALPEDVGGGGYGLMELCVLLEEVGRRVAPVPALATLAMGALPVARFGTDEQRHRLLPGVVEGRTILTAAVQEEAAADPLRVATTATPRSDGGWTLEGRKVAVAWAPVAEHFLVTARMGTGETGVFVVEAAARGAVVHAGEATNREPEGVLELDGVAVAAADLLGDPPDCAAPVRAIDRFAVAGLCATASGVCAEAVRMTAAYLSQREQFGRPLATFQGAALRAADAYIDAEAVHAAAWSAIWRLAEGRPADEALAVAKFWAADGGQRVAAACQHLHGGIGVDLDYPIHRYFLWAKSLELTMGGATTHLLRLGDLMAADALAGT